MKRRQTFRWVIVLAILFWPAVSIGEVRWGDWGSFLVKSFEIEGGQFVLTLLPNEESDNRPYTCEEFVIEGKFDITNLPEDYGFSEASFTEAIYYLHVAQEQSLAIGFGTWGIGSTEARSCRINSYGLTAEPHDLDHYMTFFTWPSWN